MATGARDTLRQILAREFLTERSGAENVAFYEREGSRMWLDALGAADRTLELLLAVVTDTSVIASAIGEIHGCKNAIERPCALCHRQAEEVAARLNDKT